VGLYIGLFDFCISFTTHCDATLHTTGSITMTMSSLWDTATGLHISVTNTNTDISDLSLDLACSGLTNFALDALNVVRINVKQMALNAIKGLMSDTISSVLNKQFTVPAEFSPTPNLLFRYRIKGELLHTLS
jgi:hypothetical protein